MARHSEPSLERERSHGPGLPRDDRLPCGNHLPEGDGRRGRRLLLTLFAIYLILLVWLILWKLETPWVGDGALRSLKPVPFASHDGTGSNTPLEVLANCVFFVPFGLYLGVLFPALRWWRVAILVAVASLLLEATQFILAIGTSDVTDVITNTSGGLVGFGLAVLIRRRLSGRALAVVARVCLVCTVLLAFAIAAFVISPLHYAPQHQELIQE